MILSNYRYSLEKYKGKSSRYHCPSCRQRNKTFARYLDNETGDHIDDKVGRCDRESSCGYDYKPSQYFKDNNVNFDSFPKQVFTPKPITPVPEPSFIPPHLFKESLGNYRTNNFVIYLNTLFSISITNKLIADYFIGTSIYKMGSTIFWQITLKHEIRTGKIILYSPITGKRSKEAGNYAAWVHFPLKEAGFELKQCLFGEHLLHNSFKPVAVVESEKTAIIASVYFPQFIWIATSGKNGLNVDKCKVLNKYGQHIYLFPDLSGGAAKESAFDNWADIAGKHLNKYSISNLLEKNATPTERENGCDIADYLIRFDHKDFCTNAIYLPAPVIKPEFTQPIREPPREPSPADCYTLQQLQSIVLGQAGKTRTPLPIYLKAWALSNNQLLQLSGIRQTEFLNSINY